MAEFSLDFGSFFRLNLHLKLHFSEKWVFFSFSFTGPTIAHTPGQITITTHAPAPTPTTGPTIAHTPGHITTTAHAPVSTLIPALPPTWRQSRDMLQDGFSPKHQCKGSLGKHRHLATPHLGHGQIVISATGTDQDIVPHIGPGV